MWQKGIAVALALGVSSAGMAQERGPQSRSPLGETIRAALIATPEVLSEVTRPAPRPIDFYAEDTARDLDLLELVAPRLFDLSHPGIGPEDAPTGIALFTRNDCSACASAGEDLRRLVDRLGVRATVFDIDDHADLARHLGLDMAPSYVMRDRILRGQMPSVVLERYLTE